MHVAEDEARKQVKAQLNGHDGSQPTDTTPTTTNVAPDPPTVTTTTAPADALSAPTNWAKRMADSAQQKVQNLQNLATSAG